jgi:hypothetical protein
MRKYWFNRRIQYDRIAHTFTHRWGERALLWYGALGHGDQPSQGADYIEWHVERMIGFIYEYMDALLIFSIAIIRWCMYACIYIYIRMHTIIFT